MSQVVSLAPHALVQQLLQPLHVPECAGLPELHQLSRGAAQPGRQPLLETARHSRAML